MINLVKKKYKLIVIFLIFPIVIPIILFYSFNKLHKQELDLFIIKGETMGTTYTIKIFTNDIDEAALQSKIDKLLDSINQKMSTYQNDSELSILNKSEVVNNNLDISKELYNVIKKAIYYSELSNGNYDFTILPLVELWGFGSTFDKNFPSNSDILIAQNKVNYNNIILSDNKIIKNKIDTKIDLSSIAKGYAVDEVSLFLLKSGYYNYLVEIGGELRAHGKNNNHNWRVGIYNPINNSKNIINLNNMSIATSGTYNNYFVHDGIEYSHIINPKTGYPIKNEILSVTVITENCIEADALATMGMTIEDSHQAIQIIENEEANALIIRKNKNGEILKFPTNNFSKYLEN